MKKKLLATLAVATLTIAAYSQWSNPANDIPAYNAAPPKRKLPAIMAGKQLTGEYFTHNYQVKAYEMVATIPNVIYQLPCYCHCDRTMGHNSLHSCYEAEHGAVCSTCLKEGIFAYQETKKGRTPAQIRASIERGEWQAVNLELIGNIAHI